MTCLLVPDGQRDGRALAGGNDHHLPGGSRGPDRLETKRPSARAAALGADAVAAGRAWRTWCRPAIEDWISTAPPAVTAAAAISVAMWPAPVANSPTDATAPPVPATPPAAIAPVPAAAPPPPAPPTPRTLAITPIGPTVGASAANRRLMPRSSPWKCRHWLQSRMWRRAVPLGRTPRSWASVSCPRMSRARGVARLERLGEGDPGANQQRFHGRDRHAERVGHVRVCHAAELSHQQRRALLLGQAAHVDHQAPAATPAGRPRRSGRPRARARARAPPAAAARGDEARRCSGCARSGRARPSGRAGRGRPAVPSRRGRTRPGGRPPRPGVPAASGACKRTGAGDSGRGSRGTPRRDRLGTAPPAARRTATEATAARAILEPEGVLPELGGLTLPLGTLGAHSNGWPGGKLLSTVRTTTPSHA